MQQSGQKKIMILGTGVFQVPLIRKAQELGHYAIALSYLPNDPGHKIADLAVNMSTLDTEAVLDLARAQQIDGILTAASEVAAPTAAFVAGELGLSGYPHHTALTISDKLLLRQHLQQHKLSRIRFAEASDPEMAAAAFRKLPKPLMLKPLLSSGSRGIKLVHTEEELLEYLPKALGHSHIHKGALLEEFMPGRTLGGQLLISRGRIVLHAWSDKTMNPHFVTAAHLLPALLSDAEQTQLLNLATQVVQSLQLTDGALDLDLVMTDNGPEIIELGGRLGGNGVAELVSLHTGQNLHEMAIRLAMGEELEPLVLQRNPVAVHLIGATEFGTLNRIFRLHEKLPALAPHHIAQHDFMQPGSPVKPFIQGNRQLGNIFLKANTPQELQDVLQQVQAIEWAQVTPD